MNTDFAYRMIELERRIARLEREIAVMQNQATQVAETVKAIPES